MKKSKKLLILCPYPYDVAPSQRLKFEQYYDSIRDAGYVITISPFISKRFWKIIYKRGHYLEKFFYTFLGYLRRIADLFRIPFYDVIYVHLWVTPFGFTFFERLTIFLSKRAIYDIDDMIYLKEHKSKANPLISALKGKSKPIYLFRKSDYVLTSTDAIADFAEQMNSKVIRIPISVNTGIYTPKTVYETKEKKLVLGWTGSFTTAPYLHLLDNILRTLAKEVDFKLLVMGDESFTLDGVEVKAIPWKAEYEVSVIRDFDIGLYPMPNNDLFATGKGGGKALQYMSLGVPTVATALGPNYKIITHGQDGFLVQHEDEWICTLKQLIHDSALRKKIGQAGVRTIEEKFSVNANKEKYIKVLDGQF